MTLTITDLPVPTPDARGLDALAAAIIRHRHPELAPPGFDATLIECTLTEVAYESGSPATGGLYVATLTVDVSRPEGGGARRVQVEAFVKILQHLSHWNRLHLVPEPFRDRMVAEFPWRGELDVMLKAAPAMVDGMRTPVVYAVFDHGDRLAVWMERVDEIDAWTDATYLDAARRLGRLAARRSAPDDLATAGTPPGFAMHMLVTAQIKGHTGPIIADDATWQTPWLAERADAPLRDDLRALFARIDELVALADSVPHTLVHGDASPANLLRDRRAPDEFVAIDWGMSSPLPLGFDVGQLLVGDVHSGRAPAELIARLVDPAIDGFCRGLADENYPHTRAEVRRGAIASLTLRSAFTMIPFEFLGGPPPGSERLLDERIAATRLLVDLGVSVLD